MFKNFLNNKIKIAIVGLGYVGLPLAILFNKHYDVIGFDLNEDKIENYKNGIDITQELEENALKNSNIKFTTNPKDLSEANFIVVAVPTPINDDKSPDLSYIISATELIASNIVKGTIIVYESTVFPGVTEDICLSIIEGISGLKCGVDFSLGYSPERVSPGDDTKKIENIKKIVSGYDKQTLLIVANIYDSVLKQGVYKANSIKVAEAAKITENIQRDMNIALMNELSIIFNNMDINTNDVIEAAATKWNFVKYQPGLVGGHCIGIDPYYLIYKSEKLNYSPKLIQTSRNINENIIDHITKNIIYKLIDNNIKIKGSKILILGITFKENCNDIRNSKIVDVIKELNKIGIETTIYDPLANPDDVYKMYNLNIVENYGGFYDAIILAVSHDEFSKITIEDLNNLCKNKIILFDLKSFLKDKIDTKKVDYWSL